MRKIKMFDTTLRDGEQSPGVALRPEGKLAIARQLDVLGVDMIEAGFPVSSRGEMNGVRLVAQAGLRAEVYGLARAKKEDIDAVLDTGIKSAHLFIPTSDIHLERKLGITRGEALRLAEDAVVYAKSKGMTVMFSAEDATRTAMPFLKEVYRAVIKAGADSINIPDTVGCMDTGRMALVTRQIVSEVRVPVSVHCHDDLGFATANSIAAVEAGADCVHVTVNGVGERCGNAALEEVAPALRYLRLCGRYETGIDFGQIYTTSKLVSELFRMPVQPNKAVVGENSFTHEAGIHAQGVVKDPLTYQLMEPGVFGRETRLAFGKHSGIHGMKAVLERRGVSLPEESLRQIMDEIKRRGDEGMATSEEDLLALAEKAKKGAQ
jgi:2-isopropylmalate synthase